MNELKKFVAQAPPIDTVREEAARCCDETAKHERGERGPLRGPPDLLAEFSDAAFGVAAEVAMIVADSLQGQLWRVDFPWVTAATLLRAGWQRGHRLEARVTRKGDAS